MSKFEKLYEDLTTIKSIAENCIERLDQDTFSSDQIDVLSHNAARAKEILCRRKSVRESHVHA